MTIRSLALGAGLAALTLGWCLPAHALTMQECSAKYKAAQTAGTLKGMKWNDFRKAECGADAAAAPATPAATPAATTPAAKTTAAPPKPAATTAMPRPSAAPAATNAVFPTAVSQKYSNESAGKARMHTCLDQYNANKTGDSNGGMKWIEKGGGYYSECNKRLKGES